MKTKSLLFLLVLSGLSSLNAQTYYKIIFSGEPDSILVENLTKGTTASLQGTDTLSLKLSGVGVQETNRSKRTLIIYPNPMDHSCWFDFENTTHGRVEIQLFNANGKKIHDFNARLLAGKHQFELSGVPAGVYVLHITTESYRMSGSFVSTHESSPDIRLIHKKETPFRLTDRNNDKNQKLTHENVPLSFRSMVEMDFSVGDQLKFTGYKTNSDDDIEYASPMGDQTIGFTFCVRPGQPAAAIHVPSQTQIIWNWNTAAATGYKYNTANNYATATDNGASTTYTQTGLTCNTAYTLYVWAYSSCGNSTVQDLTQTTSACSSVCGSPVTFTYNGSTVTYGTVTSANNRCWLDRNMGATQVAISSNDTASYGQLFQWGRLDDGHQVRTSPTTTTLSNSDIPGHEKFIIGMGSPHDWRSPQNNNLWQSVNGINNPCPSGYRLPTQAEWDSERASWSSNNAVGALLSPLKLPLAGYRNNIDGLISKEGSFGNYWSSSFSGNGASRLFFDGGIAYMNSYRRAYGFSVRCLKD